MNSYEKQLEKSVGLAAGFWKLVDRLIIALICAVFICIVISIIDMYRFAARGIDTVEYHDFKSLRAINPDAVGWIMMDGTNIDHPVVQGPDNFKYLDLDFYGNSYAGGTVFLDAGNSSDFSDSYNIVHGHHMAGGAMFGDLSKYTDLKFWNEHKTGALLTETSRYQLDVAASGVFDAYDLRVYATSHDREIPYELLNECEFARELDYLDDDQMLVLSTCSGNMSNDRIIVMCRMRRSGNNS